MDVELLPDPVKPQSDPKKYRHFKLKNGLHVLVISDVCEKNQLKEIYEDAQFEVEDFDDSDSDSEKSDDEEMKKPTKSVKKKQAAAALCVGVGSFSDPEQIPGLAHFLEHMVFMGSTLYPDENHFDMFIKRHGGDDNAFTDCEQTVFKFEINPVHFEEALKIWSQFFISPLMKKSSINREVEAVDSEFEMALVEDDCRSEQVLGMFCKQGHPIGKFMWGNKKTLKETPSKKGIKVYDALRQFHKQFYNANNMSLVVQSIEDLDTLQKLVVDIFKDVPNNPEAITPRYEQDVPFPDPDKTSSFQFCHIVPIKQIQQLRMMWFLPPQRQHYRTKPMHYVAWLLGHEGKGSVLSLLKREHLAIELSAEVETSNFTDCSLYSIFVLDISLTEKGCADYQKVIDFVFQYVYMVRKARPVERIFREMQQIEEIDFAYSEEDAPLSYVEDLCENVKRYPSTEIITGDELLFDYDVKVIEEVLNALLPRKCLIFYSNQDQHSSSRAPSQKEPWFGATFSVMTLDPEWISQWSDDVTMKVHPHLAFPTPNPYIASDFNLIDHCSDSDLSSTVRSLSTKYPSLGLWFKEDTKFRLPKAFIRMCLINSCAISSPENSAYADLLVAVLKDAMAEDVYHADAAGFGYYLAASLKGGLIVKVSGFSDKLVLLLLNIFKHFAQLSCSGEVFEDQKQQLRRTYHNLLTNPKKLCKDLRLTILEKLRFSLVDKYEASGNLTIEGFSRFVSEFRSRLYVDCLVQGNYTEDQAVAAFERSLEGLNCEFLDQSESKPDNILKLSPEKRYLKVKSLNEQDDNSMITVYFQYGCTNVREAILMQLLSVCMEEPCFDILRTKKQLGYSVYVMEHITSGILGLSVNVATQNSKFSVEQIQDEILDFVYTDFHQCISVMSNEDFEAQVESLITLKTNDDSQLEEEVDRNWDEVLTGDRNFDRLKQEVKYLKDITFNVFKDFYGKFCSDDARVLVIQVRGNSQLQMDDEEQIINGAADLPAILKLEMLPKEESKWNAARIDSLHSFIKSEQYYPVAHVLDVNNS